MNYTKYSAYKSRIKNKISFMFGLTMSFVSLGFQLDLNFCPDKIIERNTKWNKGPEKDIKREGMKWR